MIIFISIFVTINSVNSRNFNAYRNSGIKKIILTESGKNKIVTDSDTTYCRNISKPDFIRNTNAIFKTGILNETGGLGKYYVSPLGNDNNLGNSPDNAWQTIDKINSVDFEPGDRIFFKGGEIFIGNILFDANDSGTYTDSIFIGSYGTGRATIDAQNGSGIIATGCEYIHITNLNFIGNGRKEGNIGNGLAFGNCSNIVTDNIDISGFQHSGLLVYDVGKNYKITNVYTHNNGYSGICLYGNTKTTIVNIYIGQCIADNNPGDPTILDNHSGNGIFAYNASNIIMEYCEASNNGWDMPRKGNGPGGIWVAEVDNALIQHCISHNNKTSAGGQDGLGFDLDGGTTNSIIQYCLSYNNYGAGFGIFQYPGASEWNNNIIRYCISENDGNVSAAGNMLFWNGSNNINEFKNLEFYNNVIYNANGSTMAFYDHNNSNFNFRNNIFVSKISNVYNRIKGENFQGNCWFSLNDFYSDSLNFIVWAQANNQEIYNGNRVGIFSNPKLINPGNSNLKDPYRLSEIDDYKVQAASKVIDAGLDLEILFGIIPGDQDYFGNQLKQVIAFDIGIYQQNALTEKYLEVTPSKVILTADSGATGTFDIISNTNWSISNNAPWLIVTPGTGINNSKITLTAISSNSNATLKSAALTIIGSEVDSDKIVLVNQNTDLIKPDSLGYTEVYSSISTGSSRKAMPVTFSEDGSVTSISIYHNGGAGNVILGVYSDQLGLPSSQLGVSASTAVNSTEGWQTVALNSPVNVNSGDKIWLAWVFENRIAIRVESGTPGRALSTEQWSGGMPESFGSSSTANTKYSIYCTYTPVIVPEPNPEPEQLALGFTDVYGSISTGLSRKAMPVTFSEDGSVSSLSIYHNGGAGNVILGVYSDQLGLPSNQLGVTASTAVNSTEGWQTVALNSPVNVNSGDKIWLAWVFENRIAIRVESGTPGRALSTEQWSGGLPESFGSSSIANTKYSIYCTYTPVIVPEPNPAPEQLALGFTDVYGSISTGLSRKAMPVTFSEDGSVSSLSIYHNGGAGNVILGVYSDQLGLPSTQLGVTASTAVNSTEGWQTVALNSPVNVNSGDKIWLAWVFENRIAIRVESGTPGRALSTDQWSGGMPESFGSSSIANTKYSIYCTYTPVKPIIKNAVLSETNHGEIVQLDKKQFIKNINNDDDNIEVSAEKIDFKIFPNPSGSLIHVEYLHLPESETRILIVNNTGATLINQLVESTSNIIDISQFPVGIYFVKSTSQRWSKTKKLIISN